MGVGSHAAADHGVDIVVQQAIVAQFADHKRQAADCGKMVHIGLAVGVNANQQRNNGRDFVEIIPSEDYAGGTRHCHQMHGVVGGTAGGHQADHRVNKRFFVQHFADRFDAAVFHAFGHVGGGMAGQRFAHRGVGVEEGGGRQVQAHHFHQHLIGIGGAVEGAGAGAVVRAHFAFQQGIAADFAFGKQLAGPRFFFIADAAGHWAGGYENTGQMAAT